MSKKAIKAGLTFDVKSTKDADDGMIKIKGIANAPIRDSVGDIIPVSTWTKDTIKEFMKNPMVLYQHDSRTPIGKVTEAKATDEGLYVEALISDVKKDVQKLIKQGILKTFSIGYRLKDFDVEEDTGTWVLKELDLKEISVVSIPANQDSIFEESKDIYTEKEYKELRQKMLEEKTGTVDKESEEAVSDSKEDEKVF